MIDILSKLWSLLTVFFTVQVIHYPLFTGFILMPTLFYVIYSLIVFLDYSIWSRGL